MSKFSDINEGTDITNKSKTGIIYTCNCGWIDIGHANPNSSSPFIGASNLWSQILGETGPRSPNALWHQVRLSEKMSGSIPILGKMTRGVDGEFAVRLGLSMPQKESVALSILMRVSSEFEALQSRFPYNLRTDSGFSGEDLISNIMGFYTVVRPGTDFLQICRPVSKAAAETVWKKFGAPGDASNKNKTLSPNIYPCSECEGAPMGPIRSNLPIQFLSITQVPMGADFRIWDLSDSVLTNAPATPSPSPPKASDPPKPAMKTIPVGKGVTLSGIASAEYQDWRYWYLVWNTNRDIIGPNPNRLRLNITLRVPPLDSFTPEQRADAIKRSPTWKVFPL